MGARTGQQYLDGLRDDRRVWLGAERVDVIEDPRLAGSLLGLAGYFDYQHAHAEDCLVEDAGTGEPVNASHLLPRTAADLERRHRALARLARYSVGMMGRTPDYVNVTLAGFAARRDIFEHNGDTRAADALVAFHHEAARRDLSLTHTIINPVIDKSLGDVEGLNGELALRRVRRTEGGIVVSGSKILGTLGPFADENFVYPGHPLPRDADPAFALCFAVPMDAPGLHTVCRDHYGTVGGERVDHPFSARFDEQDAVLIFDEVEIPDERVFIDGDLQVYAMLMREGWAANIMQQTSIRAQIKLEFAYDLACRLVDLQGMGGRPDATRQLGELWSYAELTRSGVLAAEAGAHDWGNGAWFPDQRPFLALRALLPGWMTRANDILKGLGSHNLLCTPTLEALDDPELGPLLRRYLPGAGGRDAAERARAFRLAWDFAGSALGSRVDLYERFYLGSAARNFTLNHVLARGAREWTEVDDFCRLAGIDTSTTR